METSENNFIIFDHQKKKTPRRNNKKNRELNFMTFRIFNFPVFKQKIYHCSCGKSSKFTLQLK